MSETRKDNYAALHKAAHKLYFAGVWTCEQRNENEQVALWEALRDALGLNEGSATAQGVAATPTPPEQGEVREAVREALVRLYRAAHISTDASACYDFKELLGLHEYDDEFKFADALLARVPAETPEQLSRELGEALGEVTRLRERLRQVCETLVAEIGASGPCDAEDAAERIVTEIQRLRATPPAAETGEPVAWGVMDNKGIVSQASAEKTRKLQAHLAWCDDRFSEDAPHTLIPLYAAPAPREVSEAMAFAAWAECIRIEENASPFVEREMWEQVRPAWVAIVRAALSAETGTP